MLIFSWLAFRGKSKILHGVKKGEVVKCSVLWMIGGDELLSIESFVGTKDRNVTGQSHGRLLTVTL